MDCIIFLSGLSMGLAFSLIVVAAVRRYQKAPEPAARKALRLISVELRGYQLSGLGQRIQALTEQGLKDSEV